MAALVAVTMETQRDRSKALGSGAVDYTWLKHISEIKQHSRGEETKCTWLASPPPS